MTVMFEIFHHCRPFLTKAQRKPVVEMVEWRNAVRNSLSFGQENVSAYFFDHKLELYKRVCTINDLITYEIYVNRKIDFRSNLGHL